MILVARGRRDDAIRILEDPATRLKAGGLESPTALLWARQFLALHDGDEDEALRLALRILEEERGQGWPNPVAAQVWLVGSLFGPEHVGGARELDRAREVLERVHWVQALNEPDMLRRLARPS
jgi:hypothetical protein